MRPRGRRLVLTLAATAMLLAAIVAALRWMTPSHVFGTRTVLLVIAVVASGYVAIAVVVALATAGATRRALGRVALAVAAGLLVLSCLELPTLAFDYDWRLLLARRDEAFFGRMKPWKSPWNVPDAERVFRRPADLDVKGRAHGDCVAWLGIAAPREYDYDLHYDGRGYRNARTLDHATIAVIGDSFVEAAFVATDDLFTTRLESALTEPVVNLGVGGYGPQQELVVLERDALPLAPRLVLWFFFEGNDLNDARRFDHDASDSAGSELAFETRSCVANAAATIARLLAPPLRADTNEARRSCGMHAADAAGRGTKVYFPYPAHPMNSPDERALASVERTLARADAACTAGTARLVVVFVPEKYRVYHDLCRFPADSHVHGWKLSDLPARLSAWAGRKGVEFLDLTPPLRAAAAGTRQVYFADDGHWNARGHDVVAAVLADAARPLLATGPKR